MVSNCDQILKALLEHLMVSIYVKDTEGRFVCVSNAKADNSGTTPEKMVGKTDFDFMKPEQAQQSWADDLEVIQKQTCIDGKKEMITRDDGADEWKLVTKCPWYDDHENLMGVVGISSDITRDVMLRNHLIQMVSMASHDLRSPMKSISAILQLVIRGHYGHIDESVKVELKEALSIINKQSLAIADYLSKSALLIDENEVPKKDKVDLKRDIINPIIDNLASLIEERNIHIDMSLGGIPIDHIAVVEACRGWLSIVYLNLISNAIKYGGDNSTIAFGYEDKGSHYRLNVFNSGPPVKDDAMDKIFDLFEGEGTGLGLHSARELIRKHGGDMWYETTWDNHPNFIFTLPKEQK